MYVREYMESVGMYKIRYLKTSEMFEIIVPDPLFIGDEMKVRINDYDLFLLIRGVKVDIDDDTFLGIKKLTSKYVLSVRTMKLAKRKQHLRKLGKVESSWVELSKKERQERGMSKERQERIEYLKENFKSIAMNCVRRGWYNEFKSLCKDVGISNVKEVWDEYIILQK